MPTDLEEVGLGELVLQRNEPVLAKGVQLELQQRRDGRVGLEGLAQLVARRGAG